MSGQPWETHDRLCPMTTPDGYLCCCNLIARVREDERDKWVAFYCAEIEKNGVQWEASLRQRYREGSNDGKELERQRWEADGPWFKSVVHQCCEDKATAFEQGQRDEREACIAAVSAPTLHDDACCSNGCTLMHSSQWEAIRRIQIALGFPLSEEPPPPYRCDGSCNCTAAAFIAAIRAREEKP